MPSHLVHSSSSVSPAHKPIRQSGWISACLAEGIGTFGLVFAGCGAIMVDTLSKGQITHVGVGSRWLPVEGR